MSFLNLILKIVGLVPILYIPSISPCDAWYWGEWEKIASAPLNSEYAPSLCLISLPPLKLVIKRNFRPPPPNSDYPGPPSINSKLFVLTTPIASQLFSSLPTMTISCVCTLVNSIGNGQILPWDLMSKINRQNLRQKVCLYTR